MILNTLYELLLRLFGKRTVLRLSLYGPPNSGKTTLANRILADWLGEEMGLTSPIAHETREVQRREGITILHPDGRSLRFSLIDTPGISSRIDYKDFVTAGLDEATAKSRAQEAAAGVLASIDALDTTDFVLLVLDATKEPGSQVNMTLVESLEQRGMPLLIIANKMDLRGASQDRIHTVFPDKPVVGISAKYGENIDTFYEQLFELAGE